VNFVRQYKQPSSHLPLNLVPPHYRMKLPHWTEEEIKMLPTGFTGQIVIECWQGGVTRIDTMTRRQAPKALEPVRHVLHA